jgi:hypothetical protein
MSELAPGNVTIADLYKEMVGMRADVVKALTRIEVLDTRNTDADQLHRDHETRLRALESAGARLAGKLAVMAGGTGVAGGWVGYLLGHFMH